MPPDFDALPLALTTEQAARALNMSANALWRAAARGDAPVPFYRWGRALRWPREPIRQLLALDGNGASAEAPRTESPTTADQAGRHGLSTTAQ